MLICTLCLVFYATVEDITHFDIDFQMPLLLWYGLEIYPHHLFYPHQLESQMGEVEF